MYFKSFVYTIIFIVVFFLDAKVYSQEDTRDGLVKYTPEYRFKDGIYPNFQSVKEDSPISKTRLVTDADLFSRDFFDQVTEKKNIVYYDDFGVKKEIKTSSIWGYARNGVLYINLGSRFHRISFVGSIGHFVATLSTYNPGYYDPYYSPYYYNNRYYYNTTPSSYSSTEVRQYLIDFETGKLHEFEVYSVEILLMKDPELYDEYMALRRKKKKQYKFVYIRKYNEKHPLYLPEN